MTRSLLLNHASRLLVIISFTCSVSSPVSASENGERVRIVAFTRSHVSIMEFDPKKAVTIGARCLVPSESLRPGNAVPTCLDEDVKPKPRERTGQTLTIPATLQDRNWLVFQQGGKYWRLRKREAEVQRDVEMPACPSGANDGVGNTMTRGIGDARCK